MIKENKYSRWYEQLMTAARRQRDLENFEKHHVLPKSLGGKNNKDNIVKLTYREHFIAHWLLTKFTEGVFKIKMLHALARMSCRCGWQYEIGARARREAHTGMKFSAESKAKMSAAKKGRKYSEEHAANIRAGNKGRIFSEEHRHKLSLAMRGKKPSTETRAKMSAAKKGRKLSEETKEKLRNIVISDETRARISAAQKGHSRGGWKLSEETKKKLSAAHKGKKFSIETRAKMSVSMMGNKNGRRRINTEAQT